MADIEEQKTILTIASVPQQSNAGHPVDGEDIAGSAIARASATAGEVSSAGDAFERNMEELTRLLREEDSETSRMDTSGRPSEIKSHVTGLAQLQHQRFLEKQTMLIDETLKALRREFETVEPDDNDIAAFENASDELLQTRLDVMNGDSYLSSVIQRPVHTLDIRSSPAVQTMANLYKKNRQRGNEQSPGFSLSK